MNVAAKLQSAADVPMRIGAEWRTGKNVVSTVEPYAGKPVAKVAVSRREDLDDALNAAVAARQLIGEMPPYERAAILRRAADGLAAKADEIAKTLSFETGKALADTRTELARSIETVRFSAEEAVRITGEHVPLDGSALGAGKIAMLLRFPVGVVAAITPFNAPVNLTVHKIAPAIAAGNSVVLKPPPQASLTVHRVVEAFVAAGMPAGVLNTLYGREIGAELVRDPRVDFISFTGSGRVGAEIKAASGLKRVALELGGIGPTIVHADADVSTTAPICARNGMRLAGQSCVSVQVVYVHRSIAEAFIAALVAEVGKFKAGDPLDPATDVGPLIDEAAARRVEQWVQEAVSCGAKLHTGGKRTGAVMQPTVLTNVTGDMKVVCEEVFGPVISVIAYDDIDAVFSRISESRFGLQCGLFTQSMPLAMKAIKKLRTGGIIVNGTSTWRPDQMPYGGVKDSGIGREGPRYAIRDMTDERLVVFNY
ncbi:MAG: aldehyde dehydrogenase family protein [Xanthobacteraceae bacterium]|nr:aldehyde dehydrogenase family protein [Xanthobacteraceae bacterium]